MGMITVILVICIVTACSSINSDLSQEDEGRENYKFISNLKLEPLRYQVSDGWVYFSEYGGSPIFRFRRDSEEVFEVAGKVVDDFILDKDRIYYFERDELAIFSCKTDGTNQKYITKRPMLAPYDERMEVQGGWLYLSTGPFELSKVRMDGSGLEMVTNGIKDYSIDDEWIYYTKADYDGHNWLYGLSRMRTDGTQYEQLIQENCFAVDYDLEWMYYIDESGTGIYREKKDHSEKEKLIDCLIDRSRFFKVIGDWIYYLDGGLHKIRTDGTERTAITDYTTGKGMCDIWDNWMIYFDIKYQKKVMVRVDDVFKTDDLVEKTLTKV